MQKIICVLLALFLLFGGAVACGEQTPELPDDDKNSEKVLPTGYTELKIGRENALETDGIGVEFDPHFLSQNVSKGAHKEDWELVCRRVKELKLQKFRIQVLPEWFEPVNDNNDPNTVDWSKITDDTEEMKSLYAVLDLAEEVGAKVNITLWGVSSFVKLIEGTIQGETPNPYAAQVNGKRHFLAEGNNSSKSWIMGIAECMEEEWAENFSVLIQLLKTKKGYKCVKEITPTNEPSWAYYVQNAQNPKDKADWVGYVRMCKKLDAKFRTDGIREQVLFNLSDDAENFNFLSNAVNELKDIADLFNSHNYKFFHTDPNTKMTEWEERNAAFCSAAGKPHFIGEFGSNQTRHTSTKQYDINTFERGVFLVRSMLNYFNSGAVGMSYWVLFDQYYNRNAAYSEFMQLGLWAHKKSSYQPDPDLLVPQKDYQIRPQYYAYGLMTNHVRPGSKVYPMNTADELIAASGFLRSDGKWVYVLANNSQNDAKFAILNTQFGSFSVYEYCSETLPNGETMIQQSETAEFANQYLSVTSKKNSVTVLVQK